MPKTRALATVVLAAAAGASPVTAQPPDTGRSRPAVTLSEIPVGSEVRLRGADGRRLRASVASVEGDILRLRLAHSLEEMTVAMNSLRELEVPDGRRRHFAEGALVGTLVGTALGAPLFFYNDPDSPGMYPKVAAVTILSGAALGTVIGGAIQTTRWQRIVPAGDDREPSGSVYVAPMRNGGVGVGLTWSWR